MPSVRLPRRRRCLMVPACLPIPPSLQVAALVKDEDGLTILASSGAPNVPCPLCGERAVRVHGRYVRTLADRLFRSFGEASQAWGWRPSVGPYPLGIETAFHP